MNYYPSKKCLAVSLLVLLSGGIYLNTLHNEFVWDDRALFIEHYDLWDVKNLKLLLTSQDNLFGEKYTGYYRPLPNLTFLLDRYLWGPDPPGYHVSSIIFHILSTIVVFLIITEISGHLSIGLTGGLLFAVHPVHTEVVAWVNGRNNVVSGLFYLLSFYYYHRYRIDGKAGTFILSLVAFASSLLSKEYALTLPIMMLLYEYTYYSEGLRAKELLKRLGILTLPYLFIVAGYLSIRSLVLPMHGTKSLHLETLWSRLITVPKTVLIYFKLLVFPFDLSAYHEVLLIEHPFDLEFIFQVVMLCVLLFVWKWSFSRSKALFFGIGWILIALVPVLNIIPLSDTDNFLAERYLYLPSVGFCMACGWLLTRVFRFEFTASRKIGRYVRIFLVLMAVEVYSFESARRNLVWKNELTLWKDTVEKSPGSYLPHANLAIELEQVGQLDEALDEANKAIDLKPEDDTLFFILGQILYKQGLLRQSLGATQKALELKPKHPDALNLKGNIYFEMGRFDKAVSCYQKVIDVSPLHSNGQLNLGLALYKLERFEEAILTLNKAAAMQPENPLPSYYMARIYEAKGDGEKALCFYQASLSKTNDPARRKLLLDKIKKLNKR